MGDPQCWIMQLQLVTVLQLPWGSRLELSALLLRKLHKQAQDHVAVLLKPAVSCKDSFSEVLNSFCMPQADIQLRSH